MDSGNRLADYCRAADYNEIKKKMLPSIDFWLYYSTGVDCFDCLPQSSSQLHVLWVSSVIPLSGVGDISTAYRTSSCLCRVECVEEGRKYHKCESQSPVFSQTWVFVKYQDAWTDLIDWKLHRFFK